MAKILLIGDPHLKITKFDLSKRFLSWLGQLIVDQRPDLVVNLGDTFDTHAVLRSEVMTEFMNHVNSVLTVCPYVYLVGNHDQYKPNDSRYHALSHLKNKIPGFTIVDEVTSINDITYVPYTHNPDLFPKITKPICVAHQTFKGADFGDIVAKDGVDAGSIQDAEIIISGHIHTRQSFHSGRVHVLYPGSPFAQSASDIDQIKGISVLDTDTLHVQFFEAPLPMWRGLKYEITDDFSVNELHTCISNSLNESDHWVLEISGPKAEIVGYLDSKQFKSAIKDKSVKIKTKFNDKEKKRIKITALTITDIVDQYIDKVYSGALDKQELKSKAREVMTVAE